MAQGESQDLVIGGQRVAPGSKQAVRLPVTQDLHGGEIAVWVHAVHGARPGRTLALVGLQHGDEWLCASFLRRILERLDPAVMAGTVLVVPVANPVAFGVGQRLTQPESDASDMNRIWPGMYTWLADRIVGVIDREVVQRADAMLDFHPGPWGSAFGEVFYGVDFPDPEVVRRCRELGLAFGFRCLGPAKVVEVFPGPRSLMGYAGTRLGIPCLGVEIGGGGWGTDQEQLWLAETWRGIQNSMRHLGILGDPLEKPERMLIYRQAHRVNPTIAGLLVPEREPDRLGREVRKGELLGRIVSPYTMEDLERLEAPCDGWLAYMARTYAVRPGHWGFGVLDADGAEWISP